MAPIDYNESLTPVNKRKPIKRGVAHKDHRKLPLVCATLPILKTGKMVELLRHPDKEVLGGEWIFFLSEHVIPKDSSPNKAIIRGAVEEVNYRPLLKTIYGSKNPIDISYKYKGREFFWNTHLFVLPIKSIRQLRPDGKEIVAIREREIGEVFRDAKKEGSIYSRFSPKGFIERLEKQTLEFTSK